MKSVFTALVACLIATGCTAASGQEHGHQTEKGPNGGALQNVGSHQIETVVMAKGVMFRVYGADGQMIKAPDAAGSLTLKVGDNPKEFRIKLQSLKNNSVGAAIDLSKTKGKMLHMDVELTGIGATSIEFHAMGQLGYMISDALLISLQRTCPATGKPLGSMGAPPKIMVQGKPLFVCCAGCSDKVTSNPEKHLAAYYSAAGKEIRPGVFEATLADVSAIAAQKKCPVMDEELGGMGTPQKVNVDGKAVYICCAGCAKLLRAESEKYLALLANQGVSPPDFK